MLAKVKINNILIFIIFIIIATLLNHQLFLNYNFFLPFEEDVYSIYD